MKYLFLPNIFEYANRVRGGGNKLGGLLMMMAAWIVYFALVHDWYTRPWQVSVLHFILVVVAIVVAILVIFKWIWGSKYWSHDRDTSKEEGLLIAEWWGDQLAESNTVAWKDHAFDFLKTFTHLLAFTLVSIACQNPLIWLVGFAGYHVAGVYQQEFEQHDQHTIERAEKRTGYFIGWMVIVTWFMQLINTMWSVYGG